jgi:hypothetical protein
MTQSLYQFFLYKSCNRSHFVGIHRRIGQASDHITREARKSKSRPQLVIVLPMTCPHREGQILIDGSLEIVHTSPYLRKG